MKPKPQIILRETEHYIAHQTPKGAVRIVAKDHQATPSSRIIGPCHWQQLKQMTDSEFNGTVVLELGVGTWRKQ